MCAASKFVLRQRAARGVGLFRTITGPRISPIVGTILLGLLTTAPLCGKELVAPGPETEAVVAFLQRIIDGQEAADKPLENVMVRGRVSFVTKKWTPGLIVAEVTPDSLPPAEWYPFTYTAKEGRARYDQEVMITGPKGRVPGKVHRLRGGEAMYNLNPNSLDILGIENVDRVWPNMNYEFMGFHLVSNGFDHMDVNVACADYIRWLQAKDTSDKHNGFARGRRVLRCREESGLLVVDDVDGPGTKPSFAGSKYTFWIDPLRGYRLIRSANRAGRPGRGLHATRDASVQYRAIAPGVFYPLNATMFFFTGGTFSEKDGSAGWGRRDLEVTDVRFGDFKCDDRVFDPAALPIPVGAYVEDRRATPALTFNYGRAPLDEQILQQAARRESLLPRPNRWLWLTILACLTLAGGVVGGLLRLRRRLRA